MNKNQSKDENQTTSCTCISNKYRDRTHYTCINTSFIGNPDRRFSRTLDSILQNELLIAKKVNK